jgi:type IV pilus assembly protein PilQ
VLADARLNSITLVGDPRKVDMAVAFLTQLDLRRRQVAVNVKVIDINLSGTNTNNTSFSFGINDSFFVNDGGAAIVNFGGINPPDQTTVTSGIANRPIIENRDVPELFRDRIFYDADQRRIVPFTGQGLLGPAKGVFLQPLGPITNDPGRVGITDYVPGSTTGSGLAAFEAFPLFQYPRRFLSNLQASILSENAKILTDPTLVVQEGETANVNITEEVVTNIRSESQTTAGQTTRTVTAEKGQAGLRLGVAIDRIDDNGFVSLRVNPIVSAIGAPVPLSTGAGENNTITLLAERSLQSGLIRLRDGQTLIVSGIIRDQDRITARKIPILGDLPIIGSLFRSSTKINQRAEVIVLLTPQILDDSDRSNFGYQNNLSPDARQLLQRSQPVQPRQ